MNTRSEGENPIRVMIETTTTSRSSGGSNAWSKAQVRAWWLPVLPPCAEMLSVVVTAKPDVILLDLDLDGQNSADSLPDLLRLTNAQVLILTGGRDFAFHQAALMKGARGVIGKDEKRRRPAARHRTRLRRRSLVNWMMMGKLLESMSANAGKGPSADPEAVKIASLTPRERGSSAPSCAAAAERARDRRLTPHQRTHLA